MKVELKKDAFSFLFFFQDFFNFRNHHHFDLDNHFSII